MSFSERVLSVRSRRIELKMSYTFELDTLTCVKEVTNGVKGAPLL